MINGAHAILYSHDADATRATLAKVLRTRSVDAGGGWLIFALPPAELAVHPRRQATWGCFSSSLNQGRRAADHASRAGRAVRQRGVGTVSVASTNWAGNLTYSADSIHHPNSVAEVQQLVAQH